MTSERRDDRGLTLIELLVSVGIIALVAAAISTAVTVVLRQAPETTSRVNVSRWEQNLGTWLPADLSSAEWPVDINGDPVPATDPAAVEFPGYEPCATDACTFGTNIAHLSWTEPVAVDVDVSYRYGQIADGSWEFRRVECRNGSCTSITLVRDMPEPLAGDPPIDVAFPPVVGGGDADASARRMTVTVTGVNGSLDTLSFAGGGFDPFDLEPASIEPPDFLLSQSGCGGPIALIVDESGSIAFDPAAPQQVKDGVTSFVQTFAGTPTQLQIIGFNPTARVLGVPSSVWNNWYDLADPADVNLLLGASSPIDDLVAENGTNWEDAIYRAFYTEAGERYESVPNVDAPPPELVVFFTDGLPTQDRDSGNQTGAETPEPATIPDRYDAGGDGDGNARFSPRGWYRSQWLLGQTATRVIGVGVGEAFTRTIDLEDDTNLEDDPAKLAAWTSSEIPARVALGDLIAENDLSTYDGDETGRFVVAEYDDVASEWDADEVREADVLITDEWDQFGGALEAIALNECGGTLTVQTRDSATGQSVADAITYELSDGDLSDGTDISLTESTTSAVGKSAVFDVPTETAAAVQLRPRALPAGFSADNWECRLKNVVITDPAKVDLVDPGDLEAGVDVVVGANDAIACTLFVTSP